MVSLVRNCCTAVGGVSKGYFPRLKRGSYLWERESALKWPFSKMADVSRQTTAEGKKIILMSAKKLESCETAANCNAVEEKFSRLGIFPTLLPPPPSTQARSVGPVLNSRNCQSSFIPFLPGFTQRTSACCTEGIYEGISLFFREKRRRRRRHK